MLKIGEFSKLGQVSPKALRLYDERGLLQPAWIDRFTGYRYYRPAQLARLHSILALKDLGFSLDQIGDLLQGAPDNAELGRLMRERQSELQRHIAAEEARLLRVEARLAQLDQPHAQPAHDVVLKPAAAQTVAGLRRKLPNQGALPVLITAVHHELRRASLEAPVALIGLYHDAVYSDGGLDVEVAAPLAKVNRFPAALVVRDLPGAELMACTVHRGDYESLPLAYEAVYSWLEGSGYRPAGPQRDLFLQAPQPGEPAGSAVTEVQVPVQPKPFLSPVAKLKDTSEMEIKIVKKPAFNVVGLPYKGRNENNEIAEIWTTVNQRVAEIGGRTGEAYGLCTAMDGNGRFRYLAGFGVSNAGDPPEGMEEWQVPEETYAVFPCELSTLHEAYQYAFETWLPHSGYDHQKGKMDFELYTDEFDPSTGEETMYVYVPVRKKGGERSD